MSAGGHMTIQRMVGLGAVALLAAALAQAASTEIADAAERGDREAVRKYIQQKLDVNAAQADGDTGLHWAVQSGDLEMADLLIRAGANPSVANHAGARPLLMAAVNGNAAMIEKLVAAGA